MHSWLIAVVVLALAGGAFAQTCCPRVTSEHNADTTDLKRLRNFHAWKDKTGNDLAIAVWQYLVGYETGIYHFENLYDGPDPFGEYAQNMEPLKLLNVYNMGYCATMNPAAAGIFAGIGFDDARSCSITNPSHCVMEARYDGAWHYLDFDIRGICQKDDGTVASLDECQKDLKLWTHPAKKVEPHFTNYRGAARLKRLGEMYATAKVDHGYRWWQGSHTADYRLRPGESLTRWWQPQGGRWNHRPEYNKIGWLRKRIEEAPRGMKSNHRHFTRWSHGNGLFHYAPALAAPSRDFENGIWSAAGLAAGAGGLRLTAEKGRAVFAVFTPFVIVGKVNDLDDLDDDTEASVLSLDAALPVTISVSLDNGLSWRPAGAVGTGKGQLDLTRLVKGTYGYLAKLEMTGKAGDLAVRAMTIDTWVQVAPISLPRLKKGTNRLRYDAGDRYGRPTMPMLVLPNVADPDDLKRHVVKMPTRYAPKRHTQRIQGDVILRLPAAPGTKIAWLSTGATFYTHRGKGAARTDNRIAYAAGRLDKLGAGEPKAFKEVYRSKVPEWTGHWRCNYDTDIRLDAPAEVVFVKFTGGGGGAVNVIRACLHLTPPRPHDPAVKITHGYKLDGKLMEKTVAMPAPGDYTIDCGGEVENVFVRIEKPSG